MSNIEESYPEDLQKLLNYAEDLSISILKKLNHPEAKKVCDFYTVTNEKIIRNKALFNELEYIPNEILSSSKSTQPNEFKGLYIFREEQNGKIIPVYVGISRSIFRRLKQHAWGKLHNECTLAYLKTRHQWEINGKKTERATITSEDMLPAKNLIQNYKVVLIPITNDYDLYFLEVVLAGKFKTKWNSFRTH
jgi:predicted GIY-YIG superfamily endonuclease